MDTGSATTVAAARTSRLDRQVAMRLAATEYQRVISMLDQLDETQWALPTDCPGWSVRDMAGHMLGMAQMATNLPEMVRQQASAAWRQRREGGAGIDALTAYQVDRNAGLSVEELIDALRTTGPRAARGRRRFPSLLHRRTLPEPQRVGEAEETWTFGYLIDVILTRDPFMHRIDIARATGLPMTLTPEHEGLIIGDVVAEWAERHGQPYHLELTGPAGGRWSRGEGGESISTDPQEFCRAISGRGPAQGLLSQQVPF